MAGRGVGRRKARGSASGPRQGAPVNGSRADSPGGGPGGSAPWPSSFIITRIGADGDGIADRAVYIPLTLPGEQVTATPEARHGHGWRATLDAIVRASPERTVPPCPHFGACGGCSLQHWQPPPYAAWKEGQLAHALRRAGFEAPEVAPLVAARPGTRRRVTLAARRSPGGMRLGLHRLRGHDVVDLATCLVLDPALVTLLAPLRQALARLDAVRREATAALNLLDSGPDLLLRTDAVLSGADRSALAAFAAAHRLPRIAWAQGDDTPQTACQLGPATHTLQGREVSPPPGAFLQATREAEAALTAAVLAALPATSRRARLIELYAGCGTFTPALARHGRVLAVEGDAAALACLRRATAGLPVEAVGRDLARQPLLRAELARADCVVLDPPYAGAAAQIAEVAAARVPRVIYVSCNPAALARDAAALHAAGYRLLSAVPIDQFLWSARLESVIGFAC